MSRPALAARIGPRPQLVAGCLCAEAYKDRFVRPGISDAIAQGYTDMAWAKNEGSDNGVQRTPENSTPTSFRQWCEEVLKPAVAS